VAVKSKDLFPPIFSRHARAYDRRLDQLMSRGEARARFRLLELVDARPGMRVIDLACGPGNLTHRLAAAVAPGGEVVGVDLAPGMLEVARSRAVANATFVLMDIEELDFPDASFDAAVCGHGLQFAPHLGRALRETRRVLRPAAQFAASVPVQSTQRSMMDLLDAVVDRHLPPGPSAVDQDETRRTVSDSDLFAQAARAAGFTEARVEVIEEKVVWQSADELVALCTSWWDCASRIERLTDDQRAAFIDDALDTLHSRGPGPIETTSRSLVLLATV
jgi:ubiquinone/menaquinone biosynthesis C-methylase UbiE